MKELNKLYKLVDMDLVDIKDTYYSYNDFKIELLKELNNIKQALTPPTQEEVCKALGEYYEKEVIYDKSILSFMVYDLRNQKTWGKQCRVISIDELYDKPHLITLIGKFYEGETK